MLRACKELAARSSVWSGWRPMSCGSSSSSSSSSGSQSPMKKSPNERLKRGVLERYRYLPRKVPGYILATYVWIDGDGQHVRCRERVLDRTARKPEDLPNWHYDGCATCQAPSENADLTLFPRAIYRDPFKKGKHDVIAMCDTFDHEDQPLPVNHRCKLAEYVQQTEKEEAWFGFQQEFALLDVAGRPYGWPKEGCPKNKGPYYCAVGAHMTYGRDILEAMTTACLYAGIDFSATSAMHMPSHWKYETGPSHPMKAADDLWVSRYILTRIAEEFGLRVCFHSKPVDEWPGSSATVTFSTAKTRAANGLAEINQYIEKLKENSAAHVKVYSQNSRDKECSHGDGDKCNFTSGVANRCVCVCIPRCVQKAGKGYLEDIRPPSNCDPYLVCKALLRTCCLSKKSSKC